MAAGPARWGVTAIAVAVTVTMLVGSGCQAPGPPSGATPDHPTATSGAPRRTPTPAPTPTQPLTPGPSTPPTGTPTTPPPTPPPTTGPPAPTLRPGPAILQPGSGGERVRELQARLAQLDWFRGQVTGYYGEATTDAVAGFQAKRGFPVTGEVDQRTWDRIVSMSRAPTRAELHPAEQPAGPARLDARCLTGRVICISKGDRRVRWVIDGEVTISMDARFGAPSTPTLEGTFSVYQKSRDHWSTLYDTAMPFSLFFNGGQAVHYSSDFATYGYAHASHGCVNTRDWAKMERLYDEAPVGTRVVVY